MDKICRGSAIGEAHCKGTWKDATAGVDTSRNARGTHICGTSFKLENTTADSKHSRSNNTSDTFRSQEWFKHEANARPTEVNLLSPRFWNEGKRNSPRASLDVSMSQKSFKEEVSEVASSRALDFGGKQGMPQGISRGISRARSVGLLGMAMEPSDVEVSVFDGGRSPRGPRSPRSPRSNQPAGLAVQRGRALDFEVDDSKPEGRAKSPTYAASADWMKYSSGQNAPDGNSQADFMPSRNFSSKSRRSFSGKIQEGSESAPWTRGGLSAEPMAPPTSYIANAVSGEISKGKRTNLKTNGAQDGAKRRLSLDASEKEPTRSTKKHSFPEHPQSLRQVEEFKQSPRLQQVPERRAAEVGSVKAGIIDMQHRTSAEMASSIMPDRNEHAASARQTKYMVGSEIVDWADCGRRGAKQCFQNTQRVAAQVSKDAGGLHAVPPHSLGASRDHRNSDILRDHLMSSAPKWQQQLTAKPQEKPFSPGPARAVAPAMGLAGLSSEQPRILSYGEVSHLPSSMPKDTAYLHSGLKVYTYGSRTPGYFSPHMPHAQICG